MRSALKAFLALSLAATLAACGSSSSGGSTTLTVNMTGTAGYFPVAQSVLGAGLPAFDPTKWQIEVLDPLKVLLGVGTAGSRICNPAVALSLTGATGAWTCNGIDAKSITLGIIGNAVDNNATKMMSVTTSTGLHTAFCPDQACTGVTQGQTFSDAAPAYILPDAFVTVLAQLIHGAGKTYADMGPLAAKGYILVWLVDRTSGTPISGAALVGVAAGYTVSYPNDTFTGLNTGAAAATGTSGIAIIEGAPTGATPINIVAASATLPPCDPVTPGVTTNCIAPTQAGISNGIAFVAVLTKH